MPTIVRNQVFALRGSDGDTEWRVLYNGRLLAASWQERGPAAAHLALLEAGKARPHYSPEES